MSTQDEDDRQLIERAGHGDMKPLLARLREGAPKTGYRDELGFTQAEDPGEDLWYEIEEAVIDGELPESKLVEIDRAVRARRHTK